jgi:hypothetical protein
MQITDTHVIKGDDGKVTVEFSGEGAEAISVRMAASSESNDDASVHHAKELMVQVAILGIPDEAFEEAQASDGYVEDIGDDEATAAAPTAESFSSPKTVV